MSDPTSSQKPDPWKMSEPSLFPEARPNPSTPGKRLIQPPPRHRTPGKCLSQPSPQKLHPAPQKFNCRKMSDPTSSQRPDPWKMSEPALCPETRQNQPLNSWKMSDPTSSQKPDPWEMSEPALSPETRPSSPATQLLENV